MPAALIPLLKALLPVLLPFLTELIKQLTADTYEDAKIDKDLRARLAGSLHSSRVWNENNYSTPR